MVVQIANSIFRFHHKSDEIEISRITYSEAKANIESVCYFLQTTEVNNKAFSAIARLNNVKSYSMSEESELYFLLLC